MSDLMIRTAILSENDPETEINTAITPRVQKLLSKDEFKSRLNKQLIAAKKNISGEAGENLKILYEKLGLHNFSLQKLNDKRWHIKAKAIQELGIMNQKEAISRIYRYTNTKNEFVRMEAQTAIVKLFGFEGLRFLDVITTPLHEWQQIKLLHELSSLPPVFFSGIEKWLVSTNNSVVIFALKLVMNYHRFELYPQITDCLEHQAPEVRLAAIEALGKIYTADTSKVLLGKIDQETEKNKKAIVNAIKEVGYEEDIPQLIEQLTKADVELKRSIVRAIGNLGENGLDLLKQHEVSTEEPLPQIIKQIEGELK